MAQQIVIDGDNCYVDTHMFGDTYERRLVMTKEIFLDCYKRWVLGEEEDKDE